MGQTMPLNFMQIQNPSARWKQIASRMMLRREAIKKSMFSFNNDCYILIFFYTSLMSTDCCVLPLPLLTQAYFMNLSFYGRNIGKILCKEPAQEEHDRNMNKQLQCRIAYQIACLDMQHAQKRQHPEGV